MDAKAIRKLQLVNAANNLQTEETVVASGARRRLDHIRADPTNESVKNLVRKELAAKPNESDAYKKALQEQKPFVLTPGSPVPPTTAIAACPKDGLPMTPVKIHAERDAVICVKCRTVVPLQPMANALERKKQ